MYHQLHVEVRGQLTEVDSVSTVWVLEIELGSPGSWQVPLLTEPSHWLSAQSF